MAHELRERYASMLAAKLAKTLVTKDGYIFSNRYEGVPTAGAVKIPVRGGMTAKEYNIGTGANLDQSSTQYITLTMKDYAVNELIDGYEAAAVPDALVADRLNEAGKALAGLEDVEGLKVIAEAAEGKENGAAYSDTVRTGKSGKVVATAPTAANAFSQILELSEALDEAGVPNEGRFAVVSSKFYNYLLQDEKFIKRGDLSQEIVESGAFGEAAGAVVYKSANLPEGVHAVMSHPDYCVRVQEWKVNPSVEDIKDGKHIGASAVQGRLVYNHTVTSPEAVAIVKA